MENVIGGFWRNKRGLSPIFATLIILAVVTVLFIPVFIWATGITSQTQDSWQLSGVAATERIVIEEVRFVGGQSPQVCTVYVRNIGETAVSIEDVIIMASAGTQIYQDAQISTLNPLTTNSLTSIIKGDLMAIQISNLAIVDSSFQITNGEVFTVKVFTTRGVSDTSQVVASWTT